MSDKAATPVHASTADPAEAAPTAAGAESPDTFARAFEATRRAQTENADATEIAADDAGATSLAEELGADSQKA